MAQQAFPQELDVYLCLGLTPTPLKPRQKAPLVKGRNGWSRDNAIAPSRKLGHLRFLSYHPGLGEFDPGEYPPFVRTVNPDDVRSVLRDYQSNNGGKAPVGLIIALPLLDPGTAPPGFEAKYRLASRGFPELAQEVRARGIELRGEPGVLATEVRVAEAYCNALPCVAARESDPVVKREGRVLLPPHRPRVFGEEVDRNIEALAAKGLGARAVHRLLKGQGIGISLSSVSKRLQQYRLGDKLGKGPAPGRPSLN